MNAKQDVDPGLRAAAATASGRHRLQRNRGTHTHTHMHAHITLPLQPCHHAQGPSFLREVDECGVNSMAIGKASSRTRLQPPWSLLRSLSEACYLCCLALATRAAWALIVWQVCEREREGEAREIRFGTGESARRGAAFTLE